MWYRIAKIESEIFNIDKSNDPKNLRGLLEGFIASIKLKTLDSQTIANAFRSYKNKLVNEDIYLPNEIENIYNEIVEIYELPQSENSQAKFDEKDSVIIENLSFIKPVSGPITSNFGAREAPMSGASTDHKGIDFDGETGDSVNASEAGTVSHAGILGSFGNLVKINHGSGLETYYAHLDNITVNVGDVVKKGQMIGAMGASGRATGSHLHFELRQNGTPINPKFSS
jgi:murein DD-endopeptidase MepM/ murein hydrolase activator NlpD